MKKIIALIMCILMSISLFGCGQNDQDTESVTDLSKLNLESMATKDEADKPKTYKSLDEYIADPDIQKGFNDAKEKVKNILTIDISSEGTTLVYKYKYKVQFEESEINGLKANLNKKLKEMEKSFTQDAKSLEQETGIKGVKIKMAYYLSDGTLLAEKTF